MRQPHKKIQLINNHDKHDNQSINCSENIAEKNVQPYNNTGFL